MTVGSKGRTLILSGLGLNCEKETAYCCEKSGAKKVDIVHTLLFLNGQVKLKEYDFLIFIGGFLDGDYLGSAKVAVNRFKFARLEGESLKRQLSDFIAAEKLILGICNGFQFMVKLGLLPDESMAFQSQKASLTQNHNALFEDRWVQLKVNPKNSNIFTKGISQLELPVRHGEGKIVVTDPDFQKRILNDELIAMYYADEKGEQTAEYPHNPNGSWENAAALSNKRGNLFGLMPHPEAYNHYTNHPQWTRRENQGEDGDGLLIFKNAYRYLS
ncbi:MAG: phosphoribosylformylglycinamidine synthase subunit PurQ [Deltaproteobacteria bacterium]|nr:phosphoribosylformylglycinamidine synthase subunit PurQ [Deltaproteobacteria bacterium]